MRGKLKGDALRSACNLLLVGVCVGNWGISYASLPGREGVKVIYGADERVDALAHPNEVLRNLSKSVAGRLKKSIVTDTGTALVLPAETLKDVMNVCSSERFSTQKSSVECTGFLVGKDILVTAGHCMDSQADCEQNSWVFGFVDGVSEIKNEDVFNCKEIIAQEKSENDFAVIRLDREVAGRKPLKFRKQGNVAANDKLVVIGHPSGLPLKIDDNGSVRDPSDSKAYFVAELDTYGGNSGSPVFNLSTSEVEGILVRGDRDYVWNASESCAVSNVCASGACRGEDVQKITKVKGLP